MTDLTSGGDYADDDFDASETSQSDLRRRAQETLQQGMETARYQALQARDYAGQQFGQAQQYLTDKIVERPLAAAAVALGAGLVLGLALSGRKER